MRGHAAEQAEVVGVRREAAAHAEFPNAVDHDAGGQRMLGGSQPAGERSPAAPRRLPGIHAERAEHGGKTRGDEFLLVPVVAHLEHVRRRSFVPVGDGESGRGRVGAFELESVYAPAQLAAPGLLLVGNQRDDLVPHGGYLLARLFRQPPLLFAAVSLGGVESGAEMRRKLGALDFHGFFAVRLFDLLELLADRGQTFFVCLDRRLMLQQCVRGSRVPIGRVGRREECLQAVVVGLRDGVELVIVAAGALHGKPQEDLPHAGGHFAQDFLAGLFLVLVAADDMARPRAVEAGGDEGFDIVRKQLVAGKLFLDEAVVRLVRVERTDDVIAVTPGMFPVAVALEAVGVGVARDVQPLQRPALAVMGGGQQALDQIGVSSRRAVVQELRRFFGSRGKPNEIEIDAPQQLFLRDGRRRLQSGRR